MRLYLNKRAPKRARIVVQVVAHLPRNHEVLSPSPSTTEREKKERKEKEKGKERNVVYFLSFSTWESL
jgi:hypothetical protein